MFLRRNFRSRGKHTHAYWTLVESYRTERGPRQRVVAYLGDLEEPARAGTLAAATGQRPERQASLFEAPSASAPEWVEVDVRRLRVERARAFGGCWLGLQLLRLLGLDTFLEEQLPQGEEEIRWGVMAQVLVLARLAAPSSELEIAERWYPQSALPDLLGVPTAKVNDDRLYRALDALLPRKDDLEQYLKGRLGELFELQYDLLLYDVTSTFFEGRAQANPQAQRGYSRDSRPDCKQVCIALVVSREGMPLGYEVFAGNRTDVTTVEQIVEKIEKQYGMADRIWVMDRGMVSEDNLEFLREKQRRYILGTAKSQLRRFEAELVSQGWTTVRAGLEVKRCAGPEETETFILCRSAERQEKDRAIHARAAEGLEAGLQALAEGCRKKPPTVQQANRRVGRLCGKYSRAARLFEVDIREEGAGKDRTVRVTWKRNAAWEDWSRLSDGCYLLRSNVSDWGDADLWRAYTQLTEAEAAFRIQKSDLALRPIWHQREDRVQAHILVCFLAYVLWKTLGKMCQAAGLGDCPRLVLEALEEIRMVDVVVPTRAGVELRKRCVTQPEKHQAVLLQRLGLALPQSLPVQEL